MLALQANSRLRHSDNTAIAASSTGAIPPCRLMVVDDDEWMRFYLASILRSASYEVDVANSGREALRLLRAGPYDILVTDCQMPGMDGLTLCQRVREEFPDSSPYILMFTVNGTRADRQAGLKSGADEYVTKEATQSELLKKLNVGRRRIPLSNHASADCDVPSRSRGLVDPLTKSHNARYFAMQMPREIHRAQQRQRALSLLNCRIDRVETMARQYGHAAADEALCAFADDIRHCLRPGLDWFARIGEDRFVLVLPETRYKGAVRVACKLRRGFAAVPVVTAAGSILCTVDIDVTACESWLPASPLWDRLVAPHSEHDAAGH
jgi:diguanylate cyclase (GGDEF)-like protein